MPAKAAVFAGEDGDKALRTAMICRSWGLGLVRDTIWAFGETIRVEVTPAVPANKFVQVHIPVLLHPHDVGPTLSKIEK